MEVNIQNAKITAKEVLARTKNATRFLKTILREIQDAADFGRDTIIWEESSLNADAAETVAAELRKLGYMVKVYNSIMAEPAEVSEIGVMSTYEAKHTTFVVSWAENI